MRTLSTQASWFSRLQMTLGALMVIAVVAFFVIWYRPTTRHMQELQARIENNHQSLEKSRTKAGELPAVARMVEDLRQGLADFDRKVPRRQELPEFLDNLESLRQQSSIGKCAVKPDPAQVLGAYAEQSIHVDFEGDFGHVADYLARVENMDRMTRVRKLKVTSVDPAKGVVQVQMDLSIYFLEG